MQSLAFAFSNIRDFTFATKEGLQQDAIIFANKINKVLWDNARDNELVPPAPTALLWGD
jgi:hypothetical protein